MTVLLVQRDSPEYFDTVRRFNCLPISTPTRQGTAKGHVVAVCRMRMDRPGWVEFTGVEVRIWHPRNPNVCSEVIVPARRIHPGLGITQAMLDKAARAAARAVLRQCSHPNAGPVRKVGRGLHMYRCPDCKAEYEIDSSG